MIVRSTDTRAILLLFPCDEYVEDAATNGTLVTGVGPETPDMAKTAISALLTYIPRSDHHGNSIFYLLKD